MLFKCHVFPNFVQKFLEAFFFSSLFSFINPNFHVCPLEVSSIISVIQCCIFFCVWKGYKLPLYIFFQCKVILVERIFFKYYHKPDSIKLFARYLVIIFLSRSLLRNI